MLKKILKRARQLPENERSELVYICYEANSVSHSEKCIFLFEQMYHSNPDWIWIFRQLVAEHSEERKNWQVWTWKPKGESNE